MPSLRGCIEWLRRRVSVRALWFVAWALIGACYAFAFVELLSIGVLLLVPAVAGTYLITRRSGSLAGLPGVLAGIGAAPLVIALINRGGPGQVCTSTATSSSCTQEVSPWPWLVAGLVLVVAGVAWQLRRPRGPW
jgi:hypothetical protein